MVATIILRNSEVKRCVYDGKLCLYNYIETRINQPPTCLNCMKELGVRDSYPLLTPTKHTIIIATNVV